MATLLVKRAKPTIDNVRHILSLPQKNSFRQASSTIPTHDIEQFNDIFSTQKLQFEDYPAFKLNDGDVFNMEMLPDQPGNVPFRSHVIYDSSNEPIFDAAKHLSLETPTEVSIFDDQNGFRTFVGASYVAKPNHKGSQFAYSAPFQVFSDEGARIGREIVIEMAKSALDNGRSTCVRGIWHLSPFFRDMMMSPELLEHFSMVCGEPVLPHFYLHNCMMNVGKVGDQGPVDHWHFDGVNYVAVTLLSDIQDMKGGQLELVKHQKQKAISMMCDGSYTDDDVLSVSYAAKGRCILVQGCKLVHHVTRVEKAKEDRLSFIISLTPANAYHPGNTYSHKQHPSSFRQYNLSQHAKLGQQRR